MFMWPLLQEPDNAVAPQELPLVLPLFFSSGATTGHSHSGDPGKVNMYHFKHKVLRLTLLPYGN